MIKITRLNHTAINTPSDVEAMEQFYTQHLGARTIKRDIPEEFQDMIPGFWMQFSNAQVHVIQNSDNGAGNPLGPHVAYYVENIEAAEQYLSAQGIRHQRVDNILFTSDPAGNTIEFQQDPINP